jgi:cyclic beta-1,2-glucan synthetase
MTMIQADSSTTAINEQLTGETQVELEILGSKLAETQKRIKKSSGVDLPLLENPKRHETLLNSAQQHYSHIADKELTVSYAGEWLLDNFYIVQQSLRQVIEDIPDRFYDKLPKLAAPPFENLPRIYVIAREIALWSVNPFTLEEVKLFIHAYQKITALTMGELWALPAFLRLVNLENLIWSVGQLIELQGADAVFQAVLSPNRPADETQVANAIINLRMLATQDWKAYFESVSRVEQVLRQDPVGIYPQMDFATRNRYRKVIELLAPNTGEDEERVAETAVRLAHQAAIQNHDSRTSNGHVGYYLIDAGRQQLEAEIDYHRKFKDELLRWKQQSPTLIYVGSIALLTLIMLLIVSLYALRVGATPFQTLLVWLFTFLPTSAVAVNVVNWLITRIIEPSILPKMDFSEGIPPAHRAMVVIPALLEDNSEIDSLAQQLELHYLRNNDPHLRFALLADYTDASEQHLPNDKTLLERALSRIRALNKRYGTDEHKPFYFFLRERRWNPSENKWMGWERKRGKLAEFNRLLLDPSTETTYSVREGELNVLSNIRYVITLDADTILPKDGAHRLVGTLAHPLNQAQFDANGKVTSGYTILQPRIEISPTAANQTLFTRIFAGDSGIDLYTLAVSDVYQDWFNEGIFTGKGIYDVAAFERSLEKRVPENTLLSHDLFEGLQGRAALVTDVVLLEDYPPHYLVHTRRLHRWIRGDWQLLRWLLPRVPLADGTNAPNPFSAVDYWKIVDNLRRSLLPIAMLLLFIAGWLLLPGNPLVWTLFALFVSATPFLTSVINFTIARLHEKSWEVSSSPLQAGAWRWLLSIVFLPYEALLSFDAITKTFQRLATGRYLLQWTTAAGVARYFGNNVSQQVIWYQMRNSIFFVVGVAIFTILLKPFVLLVAAPVLIAWLIAPTIVHRLDQPTRQVAPKLSEEQQTTLRILARRTWLFFEQFVGPEDHWLPPDHFQEAPRGIIAHHTSPTNIGLLLLSTLSAYDFGYIGVLELSARLQLTFENLEKLERYRGHFLNWYDTRTLTPLPPSYVSTVDSGNLAASLLALRQGVGEIFNTPIMRAQRWQGLKDTLSVLEEAVVAFKSSSTHAKVDDLITILAGIRSQVMAVQHNPSARTRYLAQLADHEWIGFTRLLVEVLETERDEVDVSQLSTLRVYAERMTHHLYNMRRDIDLLLPWLSLLLEPPAYFLNSTTSPAILEAWQNLLVALYHTPQLQEVANVYAAGRKHLQHLEEQLAQVTESSSQLKAALRWCNRLNDSLDEAQNAAEGLIATFQSLDRQIETYIETMDFRFLFDSYRKIFHIGYNVTTNRLDNSYYDLLASEARLASLFAIALGQIPQEHWLHLSRPQTLVDGAQTLLSWSGTMFEYLMPILLMRNYPGTLLDQSYSTVVKAHIGYSKQKKIPWGISESGYYAFDGNQNYQYRAFGVPSVAFKRGLAADLVIAPYASMIALPINPLAVMSNIDALKEIGALGLYGFYEAIDYTPNRLALGQEHAVVREYMAHHQGMILLTLLNFLIDNVMVQRFHNDARIQSVELLLQEQIPTTAELQYPSPEDTQLLPANQPQINTAPWNVPINAPMPQVHYLSNGRYGVMLTSAGSGYSQWQSMALTRWRADTTLENWGTWIYVRDQESGSLWSAGCQPVCRAAENENTMFYPHKAEFQRRDQNIFLQMEVTVPPDDDLEVRRIRLTNQGDTPRRLLLTSYGEIILAAQESDQRHPAFNKLFIESEYLPQINGLLFRRRPRSAVETPAYLVHMLVMQPGKEINPQYETDRARFLGRNRTPTAPDMLVNGGTLSGTTGSTLDPIMSLAQEIELEPHSSVQIAYVTIAAESRGKALALARTYQVWSTLDRAFDQARYRSELELRKLNVGSHDIQQFQKMLSALLHPQSPLRANPNALIANTKGQSGLWAYGISGDYPIVLVRIGDETELDLIRDLVLAHRYWRNRQIKVTLVILNQRDTGYTQELYNQVHHLIVRMGNELWINRHDGIFLLRADLLNEADQALLGASARVYLDGKQGTLAAQVQVANRQPVYLPSFVASMPVDANESMSPVPRPDDLLFDNGFGGFAPDGSEYVIYRQQGQVPPAAWINVVANPEFGFTISDSGSGFTWAGNSSENRITAWRNDPVIDMPSEAIYLRDEETAQIWSPMPMPAGDDAPYLVRHGWGYSSFEHHSHGLIQKTTLFAAFDATVKIMRLRLENTTNRVRRITVTYYAECVLGTAKDITQQYIIPEFDSTNQTLLFRNPYSIEFGGQFAFISANKNFHGLTTDRTEFLGRLGSYQRPAALERIGLSGAVQAGTDPCGAVQLHVDLHPNTSEEVFFIIGMGENRAAALQLAQTYRETAQIESAWEVVTNFWKQTLSSVTVKTPDQAMNLLLPWVLYQALACRIWGRSALYQSSGAFGFRDQLQDVMSLVHAHPMLAREHILRAARYQFEAGDVLHWWHPPSGRGVRTRFSDDLIWLPFVVANYVSATGDATILQEKMPFLKGELLKPEEDERYGYYEPTVEEYTLYEHCRRALNKGLTSGAHGLPLMGSGDWNDGMNRVGIYGRGESVWVGWFLYTTMTNFLPLCEHVGDTSQALTYSRRMEELQAALENSAWDNEWYLRAFYDDGTPLGSSQNTECKIDSIAQSWAVISKAANQTRARQAMDSANKYLVNRQDQLIMLFTPPFDKTERDPGYIKGYVPGIRENGGQYTHAAIWFVWAMAEMGEGDQAEALFRLLNPIYHSDTPEKVERYRVEPYVIAADVYSVEPHVGRGGWTWYTGSSGWMYRLGIEAILGLRREGNTLLIAPCIPKTWAHYEMTYRFGNTLYQISVENPQGVSSGVKQVTVDNETLSDLHIPLVDDNQPHTVIVTLGAD